MDCSQHGDYTFVLIQSVLCRVHFVVHDQSSSSKQWYHDHCRSEHVRIPITITVRNCDLYMPHTSPPGHSWEGLEMYIMFYCHASLATAHQYQGAEVTMHSTTKPCVIPISFAHLTITSNQTYKDTPNLQPIDHSSHVDYHNLTFCPDDIHKMTWA